MPLIGGMFNEDFNADFAIGVEGSVGVVAADSSLVALAIIVPALVGEFDCYFRFPNEDAAIYDAVVGPALAQKQISASPLWVLDLRQGGTQDVAGWWCMLRETGQVGSNVVEHPNLAFITKTTTVVVKTNIDPVLVANLQIEAPGNILLMDGAR